MKNSQRASETQSIHRKLNNIKTSITPVITTGRARSNPVPLKSNKELWLTRKVRIFKTVPTTTGSTDFTTFNVFDNAGITGQIRIRELTVWNYTTGSNSTGFIQLSTAPGICETNVSTSVFDVGNAFSLPGCRTQVPRTIASNLVSSSTSGSLCTVLTNPSGGAQASAQFLCLDVTFEYKTDVSN